MFDVVREMKGNYLGEFEQLVLLAVLRLEGEGYGVSVCQDIERRTGRAVGLGSVYATLDRLSRKGLVVHEVAVPTPVRGPAGRGTAGPLGKPVTGVPGGTTTGPGPGWYWPP